MCVCKTHLFCAALYWHPSPVWLYHISPHYLTNGTIFGKYLLNIICVFWFSLQILSEIFLVLKRIQQFFIVNVHRSRPPLEGPPPGTSDSPLISPSFSSGQRNRAYWASQPQKSLFTILRPSLKKPKPHHKPHLSSQFQYSGTLRPVDLSKNTRAFISSEKQYPSWIIWPWRRKDFFLSKHWHSVTFQNS